MNKIIKIILIIAIIGSIFTVGYFLPFWRQKPISPPPPIEDLKPLPYGSESYIKNNILYTSVAVVPLACITKMTRIDSMSIMIEYKFSNTHSGVLMMSFIEYSRLFSEKDL
jgi:hypothetical protein